MVGFKGRKLGEILVEIGALEASDARDGVAYARRRGIPVGQALVELGRCDADLVLRGLALQLGTVVVDLAAVPVTRDVLALVPAAIATRARVLPLRRIHNARGRDTLVVAVAAPKNPALDELAFSTGLRIAPVLVSEDALDAALLRSYRVEASAVGEVFLGDGPGLGHVVESYFDFGA